MSDASCSMGLPRYYSRRARHPNCDFFVDRLGAEDLLNRCADLLIKPKRILDLGARTMGLTRGLAEHYPNAQIVSVECSADLMRVSGRQHNACVCACHWPLPMADNSFDMIAANLTYSIWPAGLLAECFRLLRPDGVVLLTCFGQRSGWELKQLADRFGVRLRVLPGTNVLQLGNELLTAGAADPTIDSVEHQLEYSDLFTLRRDFQRAGLCYCSAGYDANARLNRHHDAAITDEMSDPVLLTIELLTAVAWLKNTSPQWRTMRRRAF